MIGYWGRILFEVNSDWIQYPTNVTRTAEGRWETHYPLNPEKRPKRYFLGSETGQLTFDMHFDKRFTSDVNEMVDLIVSFVNGGYEAPLVIGDKVFGYDKWCCTKAVVKYTEILHHGIMFSADVEVTLEECGDNGT
ncbi:MAG: phage tail protein [bacterium]|nr:phage tail protein [bacterium]